MSDPPISADTIFAPACGPAPGPVAVIRLSGPAVGGALTALTGRGDWPPRRAVLSNFYQPHAPKRRLDQGLVLWFPPPRSYTGEAMAELQIHGGRAVVAALCEALSALPGLRMAEPGEFTRRAFDNGKMDLTEVEAVADLVAAETESQRRQAEQQLAGAFGRQCESWRDRLINLVAACEAEIDFSDQDLPADALAEQMASLAGLRGEIADMLDDGEAGERLRTGYNVVLTGPPNAGKSTLLNALSGRDMAIVTGRPGTTRDALEAAIDLAGVPLVLIDTAGLRPENDTGDGGNNSGDNSGNNSGDHIELEGIRRARAHAAAADLVLLLTGPDVEPQGLQGLASSGQAAMVVVAKADCLADPGQAESLAERAVAAAGLPGDTPTLTVSAHSGAGLSALRDWLADHFRARSEAVLSGPPRLTRHRHRAELTAAAEALDRALTQDVSELRAEDMRTAMYQLGRITGRVDVEDILGAIFESFCIGK